MADIVPESSARLAGDDSRTQASGLAGRRRRRGRGRDLAGALVAGPELQRALRPALRARERPGHGCPDRGRNRVQAQSLGRGVRARIEGAGGAHPAGEPGPAAERFDGDRNDSKGIRARHQLDDGKRALSIGARDRTRAHHHQGAGRAERAGASGAAQALGFSARCAQGHRIRDAAALSRAAASNRARSPRSCTWSHRACRNSRRAT